MRDKDKEYLIKKDDVIECSGVLEKLKLRLKKYQYA